MEEKKEIDLPEFGRNIIRFKNSPAKLDDIQLTLVGWYANYSEEMTQLELAEATFWESNKGEGETKISDPMVRAMWKITKEGHRKIQLDRTLKTIHILVSSCKASMQRHNVEARNQQ
jgi:hypothetical protein